MGAVLLALVQAVPLPALGASLVTTIVTDPLTGVALEGYDPVTYFTGTEPQLGSADHEASWGGVSWHFVSPANRDVFLKHPEIYAPQYGGHCLTSLSRGYLSDGKPRLYAISGMKLYLFYSIANREAFLASDGGQPIAAAETRWRELQPTLTGAEAPVMVGEAAPAANPSPPASKASH